MNQTKYKRLPKHIGIIPDGNRRWACSHGYEKQEGYQYGINPGLELYKLCLELGIPELTFYGYTMDNTKRPAPQTKAFQSACIEAVHQLSNRDANLLIVGNKDSALFPHELLPYTQRMAFGQGRININFLVNYNWNWDLDYPCRENPSPRGILASADISRIDLIIRWGGRRRLSGFLPVQSVYADFYVVDDYWPDFQPQQLYTALDWYQKQDVTLGG